MLKGFLQSKFDPNPLIGFQNSMFDFPTDSPPQFLSLFAGLLHRSPDKKKSFNEPDKNRDQPEMEEAIGVCYASSLVKAAC